MLKIWTTLFIAGALYFPILVAAETGAQETKQKAILVTGATRGIGLRLAEYLSGQGYFVYAGARKDEDMKRLNAIENVEAVRLDVTNQEHIDAAVLHIQKAGRGLYGLVNNAGTNLNAPLIEMNEEDFDTVLQVNAYGPYRITKAFAPQIIKEKGRIVTIGSKGGFAVIPKNGAYHMSKFALEAFTDVLAMELRPQDVHVSIIEPGNFSDWGGGDRTMVAKAVEQALHDTPPKRRYLVVTNQEAADRTIKAMIVRLLQVNQGHEYSLTTEQISAMLSSK